MFRRDTAIGMHQQGGVRKKNSGSSLGGLLGGRDKGRAEN